MEAQQPRSDSFDLNHRASWNIWGGYGRARSGEPSQHVDVLVGNEEDLQLGLGIAGPEVSARSGLDPSTFLGMIDRVIEKYPQVRVVATTLREVHSTNRHSWGAVAWINGQSCVAPTCELQVLDRVGGGWLASGCSSACSPARSRARAAPGWAWRPADHHAGDTGDARAGARAGGGARRASSARERAAAAGPARNPKWPQSGKIVVGLPPAAASRTYFRPLPKIGLPRAARSGPIAPGWWTLIA
jgi:hypothetical protein